MLITLDALKEYQIQTRDGVTGRITDFYVEDAFWNIRYLVVEIGSWLSKQELLLVPFVIEQVEAAEKVIQINLTEKQLLDSPPKDRHQPLSRQYEEMLATHYGWVRYWLPTTLLGSSLSPALPPAITASTKPLPPEPKDEHEAVLRSCNELSRYSASTKQGVTLATQDLVVHIDAWQLRYLILSLPGQEAPTPLSLDFVSECSWEARSIQLSITETVILEQKRFIPEPIIPLAE